MSDAPGDHVQILCIVVVVCMGFVEDQHQELLCVVDSSSMKSVNVCLSFVSCECSWMALGGTHVYMCDVCHIRTRLQFGGV